MHTVRAPLVPRRTAAAAAVVLSGVLAAGAALGGCEYVYDDGRGPLPTATAPPFTDPALPQDPRRNLPVTGAELDQWVEQVLPETAGQVFHTGFGLLKAGTTRQESTGHLPSGTYSLTLACKSPRRVSFTVRNGELALVDLSLRCGTSRVNVIHVANDAVLSVEVAAQSAANFAYRISRL
ncbi:hypothetical protein ASF98_10695 [Arthrobacter sp. Leaf337]|uniref:hypothetical protein n=1 Tax=Arthrobacter sp. Leaf337 TaxID=1736342 RepID=UPI0006FB19BE|nr:hypothetical protein [Arthrobacter sp. Leaf337]KQR65562.1 hypothetical protein ASF98_10695 [Arthrobacter sp. Leaf337]